MVESCHSEITKGSDSTDDEHSAVRISAPSGLALDTHEKEIVRVQIFQRTLTSHQKSGLLTIRPNGGLVSTRLADLKEACAQILVCRLTSKDSSFKAKEKDFFYNYVAEKNPDLLTDICDHWLRLNHYQVPRLSNPIENNFMENLKFILTIFENKRNIILFSLESFQKWLEFLRAQEVILKDYPISETKNVVFNHIQTIMQFA